jgi:hypothetical protein
LLSEVQCHEDIEILDIIKQINEVNPTAVILADETGTGLLRFFYLFDHNLNAEIALGYRAYNGMGMAVGDMLKFVELGLQREVLVVSSLIGVGGFAPTEIIAECLTHTHRKEYDVLKIVETARKNIEHYMPKPPWGYSLDGFVMAMNARNGIYPADTEGLE